MTLAAVRAAGSLVFRSSRFGPRARGNAESTSAIGSDERDIRTAPYVFDPQQALDMAQAGADVLVPHMGLATGGAIGAAGTRTLDDCVGIIQQMRDAAVRVNPEIIVLCHGGPIAEPEDAAYVLERTEGVVGFFGASSMERLPTETAMTENMRRFKAITTREAMG